MPPQKTQRCLFLLCEINFFNICAALRTSCVSILDRSFSFFSIGGLHIWPLRMGLARLTRWCVEQDMWVRLRLWTLRINSQVFSSQTVLTDLFGGVCAPAYTSPQRLALYMYRISIDMLNADKQKQPTLLFICTSRRLTSDMISGFLYCLLFLYLTVLLFFTAS